MRRKALRTAAATSATAVGLALILSGTASAAPSQTVTADLNGDGTPDSATLTLTDPSTQTLSMTVNGVTTETATDADPAAGIQPVRVTDVNRDGAQELVVTHSVGANTTFSLLWDYANGPRAVHTPDGKPLDLVEGGGVGARSGFECADPVLITLGATNESPTTEPAYTGQRVAFQVRDGVATETDTVPFANAPSGDPVVQVDPTTCS